MKDWAYAQHQASDQLARLHYFTMKKQHARGEVDFIITVHEFVKPPDPQMEFFAQADKQVNQKVAPFLPSGWGNSVLEALNGCTRMIREFPCEQEPAQEAGGAGANAAQAVPGAS